MLDPLALLSVASDLADVADSPDADAQLRRSISTAYYSVFHYILRAAADRFIGVDHRGNAAYAVVYRGFSHRRLAEVCRAVDRPVLTADYQSKLGRTCMSPDLKSFVVSFLELQTLRHAADYDPYYIVDVAVATEVCSLAASAIMLLAGIDESELTDLFALMSVNGRG